MKLVNYNLLISSNYILFIILSFDFVATSGDENLWSHCKPTWWAPSILIGYRSFLQHSSKGSGKNSRKASGYKSCNIHLWQQIVFDNILFLRCISRNFRNFLWQIHGCRKSIHTCKAHYDCQIWFNFEYFSANISCYTSEECTHYQYERHRLQQSQNIRRRARRKVWK